MEINKSIKYAVINKNSNEIKILFHSYFPMSEEDVLQSVFYEGYVCPPEEYAVEKLNCESTLGLPGVIILSNLND